MKSQRISSKDYEELLKLMRCWPEPYRSKIAPLIWNTTYMFNEIERLKARLDKLEQPELLNEVQRLTQAFVGSREMKPNDPMPKTKVEKVYVSVAERLRFIKDTNGIDSPEWKRMLKYKGLINEHALKLIEAVE